MKPKPDSRSEIDQLLQKTLQCWSELVPENEPKGADAETPIGKRIKRVALEYRTDVGIERLHLVPGQRTSVGRTSQADRIVPCDRCLSGKHFSVQCSVLSVILEDAESTNGTFINGKSVFFAELFDGDVITAGKTKFRVLIGSD